MNSLHQSWTSQPTANLNSGRDVLIGRGSGLF